MPMSAAVAVTITAMIENMDKAASQTRKLPWPPLETASWLFDRSSFVLIASLAFGAIATFLIVWMGIVKERHWDVLREHSNEKIAQLNNETAGLKAVAEKLKAESEASLARVAEANASALKAQADLERFKSPRVINNEMAFEFVRKFIKFKGRSIAFGSSPTTFESAFFADQLVALCKAAELMADRNDGAAQYQVGIARGVVLKYVTGNREGEELARAMAAWLKENGIEASALGGLMSEIIPNMKKQGTFKENDESWKWVVVAVGDKV